MAAQLEETQRRLIQTELLETIRDEKLALINHGVAVAAARRQALNEKEWAEVTATVNKLLLGRDAWLKQMREASMRRQRIAELTIAEEGVLNQQVDVLLRDPAQRNSVANVKYESDNVPDAAPKNATGFEAGLEGILSKITAGLGDGPFAFIGNLLQQIFSFIFPMISAFKEMGKKTVPDLIKEGSFNEADAELAMKENELINKLRPLATDEHEGIQKALKAYEDALESLKTIPIAMTVNDEQENKEVTEFVAFEQASESHQRNILMSRMKILNELSSSVAPGLAAHEELVAAERREKLQKQQADQLGVVKQALELDDKRAIELAVLNTRIEALAVSMADLKQKREDAKAREDGFVRNMAGVEGYIDALFKQNNTLFAAERARQGDRIAKAKVAEAQALERHIKEMALMDAQTVEARVKAAPAAARGGA